MTTIRRISNSELTTFKQCRRKWDLAWRRGLRPKRESPLGALAIGTNIHAALASYYVPDGQPRTDPQDELELLLREAAAALGRYWGQQGQLVPEGELKILKSEGDLQRIMLEGYIQWLADTGADEHFTVIEPESYVEVRYVTDDDYVIYIIGRLDVRVLINATGELTFLDHKTTASIASLVKWLRLNSRSQFNTYRLLLMLTNKSVANGAIYSMLRKVKRTVRAQPPFFHRELVTFNRHELDAFKQQLDGVLVDMLKVERRLDDMTDAEYAKHHNLFAYPTEGPHCAWCPFRNICPMFDDGSRVEDAIAGNFTAGEALHYYGRDDLQRVTDSTLQPGSRTLDAHPRRIEAG